MILTIQGNSLPQLFEGVAHELLNTLIDPQTVSPVLRDKIVLEAADAERLLKEWVEALLRLVCDQHILFKGYRFQEFEAERKGAARLRAEIRGELVDPLRHIFRTEPIQWRCDQVHLLNNSKTIEAQIILVSDKVPAK